jgi:hypothetical protein
LVSISTIVEDNERVTSWCYGLNRVDDLTKNRAKRRRRRRKRKKNKGRKKEVRSWEGDPCM